MAQVSKRDIEAQLKGIVSDRFIELWWDLKIPGLGMITPSEVYAVDPIALFDYAKGYQETSFA